MVGVVTQPFPVCDCQTDRSFLKTGSGRRRKYLFPTTSENPGCPLVLAPPSSASGAHCLPLVYRWLTTSCVLSTPAYDWRFSCGVTSISGRSRRTTEARPVYWLAVADDCLPGGLTCASTGSRYCWDGRRKPPGDAPPGTLSVYGLCRLSELPPGRQA